MTESGELASPSAGPRLRGPGAGRPIRYFFSGIWLLYLIQPVSGLFGHHHSALWIAGGLAITVAFCAIYVWMINSFHEGNRWHPWAALPALILLAVLASMVYGADWIVLWIYVSAATGYVVPGRGGSVRAVLAVTGLYALLSWTSHSGMRNFISLLLPVLLLGVAMAGFRTQVKLMRELSLARETVAKLAAGEERLRLARDLHDLTGQSLSMITLKSELVRKLLSRLSPSAERDAALREAGDIGRVSRQTLQDFRQAVSGYRRRTLAVEMITARAALETAGIQLDEDPGLTLRSGTFDPEAEAALAWCMREAVTNVIRHSGATTCRVRLTQRAGELALEVSDDGRGLQGLAGHPGGSGQPGPGRQDGGDPGADALESAGSGLHGMSERLTFLGGRLSFGHAGASANGRGGLRLVATVPAAPVTPRSHGEASVPTAAPAAPGPVTASPPADSPTHGVSAPEPVTASAPADRPTASPAVRSQSVPGRPE